MDIDSLAKIIKDIILESDEVTLPGLGRFSAESVPAYFSDRGYTINPPYRRIYFRPQEGEDDVLAVRYAAENGIPVEQSLSELQSFFIELKKYLLRKRSIIIPDLGRLRLTKENVIFFVPYDDLNVSTQSFGLEPVSLKSHKETPEEVESIMAGLKSELQSGSFENDSEPQDDALVQVADVTPKKRKFTFWKLMIILVITAAVLLAALAVAGRLWPEIVDKILYTPEELMIINS